MAEKKSAGPGPDMSFLDVGRTDPKMQRRLDDWTRAITERVPESENIQDRRAGESTLGYYGGRIADTARNFWSNLQDPMRPIRIPGYQQGGVVQEPAHVTHNRANLRMIAHHARRDPQRAKHLLQ